METNIGAFVFHRYIHAFICPSTKGIRKTALLDTGKQNWIDGVCFNHDSWWPLRKKMGWDAELCEACPNEQTRRYWTGPLWGISELCHPQTMMHRGWYLPGLLQEEAEVWNYCKLPWFQRIPEKGICMDLFFSLGGVSWFPCSHRHQYWRKATQMSSLSLLSLSGSKVKKDLFMTVLISSVTFYWAPVLSWDRELVFLLFLVWSDKLVPLPWDWTMDKINSHLRSYSRLPFPFPAAFIDPLSSQKHYQFCWSPALFEKELWWWLQFLREASSVDSLLFWEPNEGHLSHLWWPAETLLSLEPCAMILVSSCHCDSHRTEPTKEKGNVLWRRKRNMTAFSWMAFSASDSMTVNCFEIVSMSAATFPDAACASALSHNTFWINIRDWSIS